MCAIRLQRLDDMRTKAVEMEQKRRRQAARLAATQMAMERKRELLHNKLQLKSAINAVSALPMYDHSKAQHVRTL
jgi:hypothetical protein